MLVCFGEGCLRSLNEGWIEVALRLGYGEFCKPIIQDRVDAWL